MKILKLNLIDGDELVYRVGFGSQHTHYDILVDGLIVQSFPYKKEAEKYLQRNGLKAALIEKRIEIASEEEALANLKTAFNTLMADTKADDYRMFLTGEGNFREELATITPYKGNRNEASKPFHYGLIKRVLDEEYYAEIVHGIEADDAMAIAQYQNMLEWDGYDQVLTETFGEPPEPPQYITRICSQDKDLKMIYGDHYNPNKRELYSITKEEANRFFYYQLLTGDDVDNIKGIPGIGLRTAEKLYTAAKATSLADMYSTAVFEYTKALKTPRVLNKMPEAMKTMEPEEIILEIGNLLWMQRSPDQRWEPPV